MKRSLILIAVASVAMTSCVTYGRYQALESSEQQLRKEINSTKNELSDLRDENAELQRQNQSLNTEIVDLTDAKNQQTTELANLRLEMANMKMGYDTLIENYNQQITGTSQDLNRANNLLAARTKELSDKEAAFRLKEEDFREREADYLKREAELKATQQEMSAKQTALEQSRAELARKEAAARAELEAKEKELEQLRNSINNALVGFADKGMNVETRNGKVYVSMESKLMFASGSWTVSKEGVEAIKTLAKVLEANTDLNIMVEGHTDNAAYRGSTAVKDNWDLSVMRATSIVKLLLQYGPGIDPSRIEACGHGEYAPKVPNTSAENKAQNRRTEIILTPKLTEILNLIEKE